MLTIGNENERMDMVDNERKKQLKEQLLKEIATELYPRLINKEERVKNESSTN
jgi:hypothetical protein